MININKAKCNKNPEKVKKKIRKQFHKLRKVKKKKKVRKDQSYEYFLAMNRLRN